MQRSSNSEDWEWVGHCRDSTTTHEGKNSPTNKQRQHVDGLPLKKTFLQLNYRNQRNAQPLDLPKASPAVVSSEVTLQEDHGNIKRDQTNVIWQILSPGLGQTTQSMSASATLAKGKITNSCTSIESQMDTGNTVNKEGASCEIFAPSGFTATLKNDNMMVFSVGSTCYTSKKDAQAMNQASSSQIQTLDSSLLRKESHNQTELCTSSSISNLYEQFTQTSDSTSTAFLSTKTSNDYKRHRNIYPTPVNFQRCFSQTHESLNFLQANEEIPTVWIDVSLSGVCSYQGWSIARSFCVGHPCTMHGILTHAKSRQCITKVTYLKENISRIKKSVLKNQKVKSIPVLYMNSAAAFRLGFMPGLETSTSYVVHLQPWFAFQPSDMKCLQKEHQFSRRYCTAQEPISAAAIYLERLGTPFWKPAYRCNVGIHRALRSLKIVHAGDIIAVRIDTGAEHQVATVTGRVDICSWKTWVENTANSRSQDPHSKATSNGRFDTNESNAEGHLRNSLFSLSNLSEWIWGNSAEESAFLPTTAVPLHWRAHDLVFFRVVALTSHRALYIGQKPCTNRVKKSNSILRHQQQTPSLCITENAFRLLEPRTSVMTNDELGCISEPMIWVGQLETTSFNPSRENPMNDRRIQNDDQKMHHGMDSPTEFRSSLKNVKHERNAENRKEFQSDVGSTPKNQSLSTGEKRHHKHQQNVSQINDMETSKGSNHRYKSVLYVSDLSWFGTAFSVTRKVWDMLKGSNHEENLASHPSGDSSTNETESSGSGSEDESNQDVYNHLPSTIKSRSVITRKEHHQDLRDGHSKIRKEKTHDSKSNDGKSPVNTEFEVPYAFFDENKTIVSIVQVTNDYRPYVFHPSIYIQKRNGNDCESEKCVTCQNCNENWCDAVSPWTHSDVRDSTAPKTLTKDWLSPIGFSEEFMSLSRYIGAIQQNSLEELQVQYPFIRIHTDDEQAVAALVGYTSKCHGFDTLHVACTDLFAQSSTRIEKRIDQLFASANGNGPVVICLASASLLLHPGNDQELDLVPRYLEKLKQHFPPSSSSNKFAHPIILVAILPSHVSNNLVSEVQELFAMSISAKDYEIRPKLEIFEGLQGDGILQPSDDSVELNTSLSAITRSQLLYAIKLVHSMINRASCNGEHTAKFVEYSDILASIETVQNNHPSKQQKSSLIPTTTWNDVGGLERAKYDILETIELPLKRPDLLPPGMKRTGLLLYGPPGTGKTLLAKAIANECNARFINVNGPELIDMYVGQSEANIREVFANARERAPCIIFFDELDSLAPARGRDTDSGAVMDRIVSQLLTELDSITAKHMVFVIGATNRPDMLDQALLRPGRLDKCIHLGHLQTLSEKIAVLKACLRDVEISQNVDIKSIANQLPLACTSANVASICKQAIQFAVQEIITKREAESQNQQSQQDVPYSSFQTEDQATVQVDFQSVLYRRLTPLTRPSRQTSTTLHVVVEMDHFLLALKDNDSKNQEQFDDPIAKTKETPKLTL